MVCTKQINLNVTPEFERDLRQYMKLRKLDKKSDAIRLAVREALSRGTATGDYDFRAWLGLGLKAPQRTPRFRERG